MLSFLLLRAATCDDERLDEIVARTLDAMAEGDLYDRAEDGFFRYSTQRDWSAPHYEKMLEDNAKLASVYLEAALRYGRHSAAVSSADTGRHAVTAGADRTGSADRMGEDARHRYADVAAGVIRYMTTVLWLPAAGAFAGSQDADEHYYGLDLDARRELGAAPFVDPTVYVDWNARAAQALIRAAVVLERPEMAEQALKLLDGLWDSARGRHGMAHYLSVTGDRVDVGPVDGMLGDQAYMAAALLDAYEWSGRRTYLARAEVMADWVEEHLTAPGGSPVRPGALDRIGRHACSAAGRLR